MSIFSEQFVAEFQKKLNKASMHTDAEAYLAQAIRSSLLVGATAAVFAVLTIRIYGPFILALPILFAALIFNYLTKAPERASRRIAQLVNLELPLALREIAVLISIRTPFNEVIERMRQSDYAELKQEFGKIATEIERGSSFRQACTHAMERIDSTEYRKALASLVTIYEKGAGEGALASLNSLASDLIAKKKSELKEFSAKSTIFSLLFTGLAVVVPTLSIILILVGSIVLDVFANMSPLTAFLIPIFLSVANVLFLLVYDYLIPLSVRERTI